MDQLELDFGVAAFSDYDKDGILRIQSDSPNVDASKGTNAVEALCPLGFYARPLDPEKDSGATVGVGATLITARAGNDRYQIPLSDQRDAKLVPKLKKGGRMMAGGAGKYRSFVSIDGLDPDGKLVSGSIQAIASYDKGGAKKSLGFSMNVRTPGKEDITIVHGEGHIITMSASGSRPISLINSKGNAWVVIDDDGVAIAGDTKVQGSMQVGQAKGAQPVGMAPAISQAFAAVTQAILAVAGAAAAAPGAQGAPAAAAGALQPLASILSQIAAKHLTST